MNTQHNVWDLLVRFKKEFPVGSTVFPAQCDVDWVQGTVIRHIVLNLVSEILVLVMTADDGEIGVFPRELSRHCI